MGVDILTSSVVGAIGLCVGCASAATDKYSYMATTPDDAKPAPLPKSNRPAATARTPHRDADAVQSREPEMLHPQYNTIQYSAYGKHM